MTLTFKADSVPNLLVNFFYLQILDILTTLAFLANGVAEANPLVRLSFSAAHSPLGGLLLIKGVAAMFAGFCCLYGKRRLLERVNMGFAGLVVWNLVALIRREVRRSPRLSGAIAMPRGSRWALPHGKFGA